MQPSSFQTHRVGGRGQRGLSLVELMVGIAVGLFIVAGAAVLVSSQLGENRRLLLETQVQQDLRAAADIIVRDLRRSGYMSDAGESVAFADPAASAPQQNSWNKVEIDPGGRPGVEYTYQRNAYEEFGFRRQDDVIMAKIGDSYQALTDANTLKVTKLEFTKIDTPETTLQCPRDCPPPLGGKACWPTMKVTRITFRIEGHAKSDPSIQHTVTGTVRPREEQTTFKLPNPVSLTRNLSCP